MIFYIPYVTDEHDYSPSWTGNTAYPTITIRGIFTSKDLAYASITDWKYEYYDYDIMEYYIDDEYIEDYFLDKYEEDEEERETKEIKAFNIDYENHTLTLFIDNEHGYYETDKIYNEDYSAVYDEHGYLGVTDY